MPEPRFDQFAEWNFIASVLEGTPPVKVLRWLLQVSGATNSVHLPSGILDWVQQADPIGSPPATPPVGRVRSWVANRLLQIEDENGAKRSPGEIIGTNASGLLEAVPPGNSGSVLIYDTSEPTNVSWAQALSVTDIPGQYQFGTLPAYGAVASVVASEIQYSRIFITKDTVLQNMLCFLETGGSVSRYVRMGIYSQANPEDVGGTPLTRVAQTNSVPTGAYTNAYIDIPLTSSYTIPKSGFYWLAHITDTATPLRFAVTSGTYPANFLPTWREVGSGTTLPATTGSLSNPASAVVFVGTKE